MFSFLLFHFTLITTFNMKRSSLLITGIIVAVVIITTSCATSSNFRTVQKPLNGKFVSGAAKCPTI